jgi:hypothetical protein
VVAQRTNTLMTFAGGRPSFITRPLGTSSKPYACMAKPINGPTCGGALPGKQHHNQQTWHYSFFFSISVQTIKCTAIRESIDTAALQGLKTLFKLQACL